MDKLKTKLKGADWWEISYLIIYGAVLTFEFLNTTMFEVKWPPRFAYIFMASSALYVIAKFIWHNTYTKKETICSAIILFAFVMPAIVTDYSFLWSIGFLIVGAKDIDFDKILKVYLVIGITIMVTAFGASQMGMIKDLVFYSERGGELITQRAYGIIYHTDFAAHVFYLAVAAICLAEDKFTVGKVIGSSFLALFIWEKCAARTTVITLVATAFAVVFIWIIKKRISGNLLYYIVNFSMICFAGAYITLTHIYDPAREWLAKLNTILSSRLEITSQAVNEYEYTMFGQNIVEHGWGRGGFVEKYFFLDDSYIRILLLYGVLLFFVTIALFYMCGLKAIRTRRILILFVIAIIGLHSFMEHHLLDVAYNPFLFYLMSNSLLKEKVEVSNVSEKE